MKERALVSFYRTSIGTFPPFLRVSEIVHIRLGEEPRDKVNELHVNVMSDFNRKDQ